LVKPRSFDVYKNATVPIIAILGYSEVNTEVLDADMETVESNNCRGISENDRDANSVLARM